MARALTADQRARYSRQILLNGVGEEGQARLLASSVLVVGAGGLGSPAAMYLAAAGVGRLGIVDFDRVELSNLHRQPLHGTRAVGVPKVRSAGDRLADMNPDVHVELHDFRLDVDNALEVVGAYDVVVDASDNFATRYLVSDACEILGRPDVYGAIFRFEGQASVFHFRGGPSYRDLHPSPPDGELAPNCAEAGVLGALPGIIGLVQATEALKILLGLGDVLSGRLLLFDALAMRFDEVAVPKVTRSPITVLRSGYASRPEGPMPAYATITAKDLKRRLDEGWKPYVLDVRRPAEADVAKLDFADRLHPHDDIARIAAELPRDRDIVVHCKMGGRSAAACETLAGLGFTRLHNLAGGINAWSTDVDPRVPRY